jgi:hypothetical protein
VTKNYLNNWLTQGAICKKGENITKNEGYLIGIQWKANSFMCLLRTTTHIKTGNNTGSFETRTNNTTTHTKLRITLEAS